MTGYAKRAKLFVVCAFAPKTTCCLKTKTHKDRKCARPEMGSKHSLTKDFSISSEPVHE